MHYSTLLIDFDHTLLDSDASAHAAFAITMVAAGVADPSPVIPAFEAINAELWAAVESGDLSPNDIRSLRFERLVRATGIDADPGAMADLYVQGLGAHGGLYPGVADVLDALAERASLALVTNGIGEVQRARIERLGLAPYFDAVVISGEVGSAKPATEIFDIAFERLGRPDKTATLMVGDNPTSDIAGGIAYGIDTCWYSPNGAVSDLTPTHRITDLAELLEIVRHPIRSQPPRRRRSS